MVNWEKLLNGLMVEASNTSLGGMEDMSNNYTSKEAAR
jgi:hypothetical protein